MSSACPTRRSGYALAMRARTSGVFHALSCSAAHMLEAPISSSEAGIVVPGQTTLKRTPWRPFSRARVLLSAITPALHAAYTPSRNSPMRPASDPMLTTAPPRRAIMPSSTARVQWIMPQRLSWTSRSHSSRAFSTKSASRVQPTLFTRTSARPNRPSTAATIARTSSHFVTSVRRTSTAFAPNRSASVAVLRACASSTSAMTRFTPSRANARLMARPIFEPPPVTITLLPARFRSIGVSSGSGRATLPLELELLGDDLAQPVLLDLPARGHGQLGHHLEPLGKLLPGDLPRLQKPDQLGERGRLAGSRDHERAGALLEARVGHPDDGDRGDLRVRKEQVLDLGRGQVLAAADDEVLRAAGDREVSVLVEDAAVAGPEPAVRRVRLRGECRTLEVAERLRRGADEQVALRLRRHRPAVAVDDAQLRAGERMSVGPEHLLGRVGQPVAGHEAVLGHAPPGGDRAPEPRAGILDQLARDRGTGTDEQAQGAHVVPRERRGIRQVLEERGRAHREGDALDLDEPGRGRGIPDVEPDARRAEQHRRRKAVEVAGLMAEGRRHQDHVLAGEPEPLVRRPHQRERRVLCLHNPLPLPGGAGGEDHLVHGVRIGARERGPSLSRLPGGVRQLGERSLARRRCAAGDEHAPEARQLGLEGGHHCRVVEAAEPLRDHDGVGLEEPEDEPQLGRAVDRRDRIQHGAEAIEREGDEHELVPVGELDGDDRAARDAVSDSFRQSPLAISARTRSSGAASASLMAPARIRFPGSRTSGPSVCRGRGPPALPRAYPSRDGSASRSIGETMDRPPSMTIVWPVMKPAASEARNMTRLATSSAVPRRRTGVAVTSRATASSYRTPSPRST